MPWTLNDPVTGEVANFAANPNDGGSPFYQKNLTVVPTTAPDGNSLVFEGRTSPKTGTFKGEGLTQADYQFLLYWYNKRYPIKFTDDLGRTFVAVFTQFTPKRKPWRHWPDHFSYEMDYILVDASGDVLIDNYWDWPQ